MHDDLLMMRQLEMEKCFRDFQIPCRWAPDMGYGFGFPLFNFYPPLPYWMGEVFRIAGFSFVNTVKLAFALAFYIAGIGMYVLAKQFFGTWGGVSSAVFYTWAPYHAVDVYVRGAMNETWALAWFPLILWVSYKFIKEREGVKFFIPLALSWFALLTTHNIMVLIFVPIFTAWCLLFLARQKAWKMILPMALAGLLAFGLAAFFTLPSILEQPYIQVRTLISGYYDYTLHFVSLSQLLFSRFWGYGASVPGPADGMSFQIGHFHWVLSLIVGGPAVFLVFRSIAKKKKTEASLCVIVLMLWVGWMAAFMAHYRSIFIWQGIPLLQFIQFPWRFLAIATFAFSFLAGGFIYFLKERTYAKLILAGLVLVLVFINWSYFLPERGMMLPQTDRERFTGAAWESQQSAGIYDYLPIGVREAPRGPRKALAEVMEGTGIITDAWQNTNSGGFLIAVRSEKVWARINLLKFPGWTVYLDEKEIPNFLPETEKWGRIYINVPAGKHEVTFKLHNTAVRTIGDSLSLLSWLGLIVYWMSRHRFPHSPEKGVIPRTC